ncbi:hypothetical protein Psal006b_03543 (plasmid) [Piscirickettsia salmonis]|uniref:Uncharacterized protein n=1 Tax=Piscirickettsia salmonis TaxID=1238 RepID=A0AAC8VLA1_PISSA|nr:hypothetical protein [Piscirickettsia salmonis]ALB24369.1 hypothetical protein KU39_1p28 [Piscirickettsia salmonis]KLV36860.1 hypothetical protein AB894_00830 [Piscirickettsia salmonis]QGO00505.1 hypothetical protein Psal006b_03543 [Piscirickettsia salmonis]QGO14685.1 hypothetical protein Psal010b_03439 [Piscirickettsia salmonis]QGO25127.1 hypothetical protein Psal025_03329 [Piscirickettsia salmonis]
MSLQKVIQQLDLELGQCSNSEITPDATVQLLNAASKLAVLLVLMESSPLERDHWVKRLSADFKNSLIVSTRSMLMDSSKKNCLH